MSSFKKDPTPLAPAGAMAHDANIDEAAVQVVVSIVSRAGGPPRAFHALGKIRARHESHRGQFCTSLFTDSPREARGDAGALRLL